MKAGLTRMTMKNQTHITKHILNYLSFNSIVIFIGSIREVLTDKKPHEMAVMVDLNEIGVL
jgi:hypothetical protein